MKRSLFAGFAILLAVAPAGATSREFGVLLSPDDYVYLAAQGIERYNPILQKMGPFELNRLHRAINDNRTQADPVSKTKAVMDTLAEAESNQQWEAANPGQLWNQKKRVMPAPIGF